MTFEERLENVKLMHETMMCMNHENAYMTWIYTMPDCPQEEDFEWFAEDADEYSDLLGTFFRILDRYIKYGLYEPSGEVIDFVVSRGYIVSATSIFRDERR